MDTLLLFDALSTDVGYLSLVYSRKTNLIWVLKIMCTEALFNTLHAIQYKQTIVLNKWKKLNFHRFLGSERCF